MSWLLKLYTKRIFVYAFLVTLSMVSGMNEACARYFERIGSDNMRSKAELTAWADCSIETTGNLGKVDKFFLKPRFYREFRDQLASGQLDRSRLCKLDGAMVILSADLDKRDDGLFAALLRLLARNWVRVGETERSEQLLEFASKLKNVTTLEKIILLQDWALLKIRSSQFDIVLKLARMQSALAKEQYQADQNADILLGALRFEARLMEKYGDKEVALKLREEIDALRLKSTCSGMCWHELPNKK